MPPRLDLIASLARPRFSGAALLAALFCLGGFARGGDLRGGVILYGGAFCPPHTTHVREARAALDAVGAERVLFIPSSPAAVQYAGEIGGPSWANIGSRERMAMTWLATRVDDRLDVSAIELGRDTPGYSSSRTILELSSELPGPVYVLLGSDVMDSLTEWERYREVLDSVELIVSEYAPYRLKPLSDYLPRDLARRYRESAPGFWERDDGRRILYFRFDTGGLSSRRVRAAAANAEPLAGMVGPWVARYIRHRGLFRNTGVSAHRRQRGPRQDAIADAREDLDGGS